VRPPYSAAAEWIASYTKFGPVCAEMAITEFYTAITSAADSVEQANQYAMLFKCYLDRSKRSGHGKIVSVTKAGLNDRYDAFTGVQSGLWDSTNQCKLTFYAIANVGINYHALDSLIAYADRLNQNKYTAASWAILASALTSAKSAMTQNYSASVSAATALGQAKDNLDAAIHALVTAVARDEGKSPTRFSLGQNYPNPFNPSTTISFSIPSRTFVSLGVFDLLGRKVATLATEELSAGHYARKWNPVGLPNGMYLYHLQAGTFTETRKLVLLKR
jgi:hypothetical protein